LILTSIINCVSYTVAASKLTGYGVKQT